MEIKTQKILLVDDEEDILEFLSYNLRKEGFQVFTASNGLEAIKIAKKTIPHLIILDVMMPNMDGIETCQELNKIEQLKSTIKIFLTARAEDYSQIAGFEAGADDYVAKPVKPKVLVSRIKALLRRNAETDESSFNNQENIVIGNLTINPIRYLVIFDNKEIILPRKEFELLRLLASRPGKVFTRDEILSKVWGNDVVVGDRTIDVHIRKLREKIAMDKIVTIKGVGYKFED
jgi:two-component system alkaline phosphatase synthesis response regulator PhoP